MKTKNGVEKGEFLNRLFGRDGDCLSFFNYCDELLQLHNDSVSKLKSNNAEPLVYEDVLQAVGLLKSHTSSTKEQLSTDLCKAMGSNRSKPEMASLTNLAIQAMVMVDCDPAADYSIRGYRPMSWTRKESFLGFMERSFPIDPNPSMNQKVEIALEEKTALKAWKLQKRLNVTFLGTNNISEHLLFDPKENYLYIFHHVGFLKAHLEMAREHGYPLDQSMADSLQKGTLPPQLLVETLHSVQSILFPSIDRKSVPILDDLIANQDTAFDRECADYDGYGLFQEPPAGFSYLYWGDRLALLHELVISRPPRNKLERWLHRQSNEGNALFIALVALLISIFVGILSIGIGAVQIWIAWMAWKYPLTDSSG